MSSPRVLFEGDGLLVIDKPPGVTVIPGRDDDAGANLREQLEAARKQKIWVVHRLDRDTSGVLVFALNAEMHRRVSMAFENGAVRKRYLALVEGLISEPQTVDVALAPARRGRMRPAGPEEEGSKAAVTVVRPVEALRNATLVQAEPLTGRTHQIRVHLRALGHPLLFDHQYGRKTPLTGKELGGCGEEPVLARTPLHAAELELPELAELSQRAFRAELPDDMQRTVELLRAAPEI